MRCGVENCGGDHDHLCDDADGVRWQIVSPRRLMRWVEAEPETSGGGGCWGHDARLKREGLQPDGGRGGGRTRDCAAGGWTRRLAGENRRR